MGRVYLKANGKLVRMGDKIVVYNQGFVPPVVLGYPMYLYGLGISDTITLAGSGEYNIIDDGGTTIADTLPNQMPYQFVLTPSYPVTLKGNNVTGLNTSNIYNITEIIVSANTNLQNLNIEGDTSLFNIDLNHNTNLTTLTIGGNNAFTDLILSGCTSLATFNVSNTEPALTTLDLSNTQVTTFNTGNIQFNSYGYLIWKNSQLTSYSLQSWYSNLNPYTYDFSNSTALSSVDFTGDFATVFNVYLANCSSLLYLNIAPCSSLRTLNINNCGSLTSLTLPNPPALISLSADSCALDQSSVDNILLYLDTYGSNYNGYCNLSGTSNAAPTNGLGNTNYLSLTNDKGWTVFINGSEPILLGSPMFLTTTAASINFTIDGTGPYQYYNGTSTVNGTFSGPVSISSLSNNGLVTIRGGNVTTLDLNTNTSEITEVMITGNTNLEILYVSNLSMITALDLDNITELTTLGIGNNTSWTGNLILTGNTSFATLDISGPQTLDTLDLTHVDSTLNIVTGSNLTLTTLIWENNNATTFNASTYGIDATTFDLSNGIFTTLDLQNL